MASDEKYIIDLCDRILGETAKRQYRFHFLLGFKSQKTGKRYRLPVDAYYPKKRLVIEYHEYQHTNPVALWNRITACGLTRDEQRRRYDRLRRRRLPKNGIELVIFDFKEFPIRSRRLRRIPDVDEVIISKKLRPFLSRTKRKTA